MLESEKNRIRAGLAETDFEMTERVRSGALDGKPPALIVSETLHTARNSFAKFDADLAEKLVPRYVEEYLVEFQAAEGGAS